MDGFLQMVSCTSEIIIPWYTNNLVMYIEREEWLKNQILNSDMSKYSKSSKRLIFLLSPETVFILILGEEIELIWLKTIT